MAQRVYPKRDLDLLSYEAGAQFLIDHGDGVFSAAVSVGSCLVYKALQGAIMWECENQNTGRRTFHTEYADALHAAQTKGN